MNKRPRIGIALSGGSSRAIAQVGVLEVLAENNIPIDYIVGCSSGSFVAMSFVGGKMQEFKDWMHDSTLQDVYKLWSINPGFRGGLFNLDKTEELIKKFLNGTTFETANPKIGFAAADLKTGELVTISMGDIMTAVKASCAVPGLFEPVVWGNKLLVDGGLVSIVPTMPVKQMGADIVIGVNISGARFIYEKKLPLWRKWRLFTKLIGWEFVKMGQNYMTVKFLDALDYSATQPKPKKIPNIISMVVQAMDLSMKISDQWNESEIACDVMITPDVKHYRKMEMDHLTQIYQEGRRSALAAIPAIKKILENSEARQPVNLKAVESRA